MSNYRTAPAEEAEEASDHSDQDPEADRRQDRIENLTPSSIAVLTIPPNPQGNISGCFPQAAYLEQSTLPQTAQIYHQ